MLHVQSFTFSPIQENTYVLYNDEKQAVIIDPGCYTAYEEMELADFISSRNLTVEYLLQTHCHLDHVFGTEYCANRYNLQPCIHPAETVVLNFAEQAGIMWGLPFTAYTGPVHHLAKGPLIQLGEDELTVLFVPGHSPGHVAFYCAAQQFVIGGDVLFRESIGRTDLPGGNHQQLLNSIEEEFFTLPAETKVYSGHGPYTTIAHEKANNPFFN